MSMACPPVNGATDVKKGPFPFPRFLVCFYKDPLFGSFSNAISKQQETNAFGDDYEVTYSKQCLLCQWQCLSTRLLSLNMEAVAFDFEPSSYSAQFKLESTH